MIVISKEKGATILEHVIVQEPKSLLKDDTEGHDEGGDVLHGRDNDPPNGCSQNGQQPEEHAIQKGKK